MCVYTLAREMSAQTIYWLKHEQPIKWKISSPFMFCHGRGSVFRMQNLGFRVSGLVSRSDGLSLMYV